MHLRRARERSLGQERELARAPGFETRISSARARSAVERFEAATRGINSALENGVQCQRPASNEGLFSPSRSSKAISLMHLTLHVNV